MGKTTKWLKSLLGMKKPNDKSKNPSKTNENVTNNKWFNKRYNNGNECEYEDEQNKHAIAVAAATAAAADAAVVAAQAAVAVVRLTSYGRRTGLGFGFVGLQDLFFFSALKIQAFFRGYLARRAHRALKGLVKLQALVRGYLVRKRAAATLYSMQALIRAQATVRSHRATHALNKGSKFQSEFQPRRSVERFDEMKTIQSHSKRLSTSHEPYNPHEGSPKIVEIDTFRPRISSRRMNNPSMYDYGGDENQYPTMSSPLPYPLPSKLTMSHHNVYDWNVYADDCRISTAQSTPRFANSKLSNGPLTPSKSVCGGDGFFRSNFNHPSYMANTQSFRAKLRSQSAPKYRPESRSKKGLSLDEVMAGRNSISGVRMHWS